MQKNDLLVETGPTAGDRAVKLEKMQQMRATMKEVLAVRELGILCSRYGLFGSDKLTLDQIGAKFEITKYSQCLSFVLQVHVVTCFFVFL